MPFAAADLEASAVKLNERCWRVVEAQHRISTMKLTDTLAEQRVLEDLIEETKPPFPRDCAELDFLLATPFRYSSTNPHGSRFRRPFAVEGVFYASEDPETAIAETAFHRLLFYAESPDTPWPANAGEFSAFACSFRSGRASDITQKPFSEDRRLYHRTDYSTSQVFADLARTVGFDVIRYRSVRDPERRSNLALLGPKVFSRRTPVARMSWKLYLDSSGARALCEAPRLSIEYGRRAFAADRRIAKLKWDR
ncbi:RES family NAD+ phosphorylase [Bradyrhizobium sp. NP1]|uniref:RES family NAD+ phosphorylase n=1 Tax=Bradyrhizobium sp. NP1 TaxID=3049772 RepID=UPI0025A6009E|nr:RES family NAD+ phosphorylase [Bradyrhizobium sp. NP1]WJR76488.1 RES family NAD+ phosphorylase [Bradyrhizobium sp. NP1]